MEVNRYKIPQTPAAEGDRTGRNGKAQMCETNAGVSLQFEDVARTKHSLECNGQDYVENTLDVKLNNKDNMESIFETNKIQHSRRMPAQGGNVEFPRDAILYFYKQEFLTPEERTRIQKIKDVDVYKYSCSDDRTIPDIARNADDRDIFGNVIRKDYLDVDANIEDDDDGFDFYSGCNGKLWTEEDDEEMEAQTEEHVDLNGFEKNFSKTLVDDFMGIKPIKVTIKDKKNKFQGRVGFKTPKKVQKNFKFGVVSDHIRRQASELNYVNEDEERMDKSFVPTKAKSTTVKNSDKLVEKSDCYSIVRGKECKRFNAHEFSVASVDKLELNKLGLSFKWEPYYNMRKIIDNNIFSAQKKKPQKNDKRFTRDVNMEEAVAQSDNDVKFIVGNRKFVGLTNGEISKIPVLFRTHNLYDRLQEETATGLTPFIHDVTAEDFDTLLMNERLRAGKPADIPADVVVKYGIKDKSKRSWLGLTSTLSAVNYNVSHATKQVDTVLEKTDSLKEYVNDFVETRTKFDFIIKSLLQSADFSAELKYIYGNDTIPREYRFVIFMKRVSSSISLMTGYDLTDLTMKAVTAITTRYSSYFEGRDEEQPIAQAIDLSNMDFIPKELSDIARKYNAVLTFSKNALTSVEGFTSFVVDLIYWILGLFNKEYLIEYFDYKSNYRISRFLKEASILLSITDVEVGSDPEYDEKLTDLYKQSTELYTKVIVNADSKKFTYFRDIQKRLKEKYDMIAGRDTEKNGRVTPFVVALVGPSQIGKSQVLVSMVDAIASMEKVPEFNRTYARGPTEYWDGYTGQFATIYDDWAQGTEYDFTEFIELVSCNRALLKMASLDDASVGKKGTEFKSKLIAFACNALFPPVSHNVRTSQAVFNRRHLCFRVEKVKPFDPDDVENSHLRFYEVSGVDSNIQIRENQGITFKQVVQVLRKRYVAHMETQNKLMRNRALRRALFHDDSVDYKTVLRELVPSIVDQEAGEAQGGVIETEIENQRIIEELVKDKGEESLLHLFGFDVTKKHVILALKSFLATASTLLVGKLLYDYSGSIKNSTNKIYDGIKTKLSRKDSRTPNDILDANLTKEEVVEWFMENPKWHDVSRLKNSEKMALTNVIQYYDCGELYRWLTSAHDVCPVEPVTGVSYTVSQEYNKRARKIVRKHKPQERKIERVNMRAIKQEMETDDDISLERIPRRNTYFDSVIQEATECPRATEFVEKQISKNYVKLEFSRGNTTCRVNGVVVKGRSILSPLHVFMDNGKVSLEGSVRICFVDNPVKIYDIPCENLESSIRYYNDLDYCVFEGPLNMPQCKDITTQFITEKDLNYLQHFNAELIVPRERVIKQMATRAHMELRNATPYRALNTQMITSQTFRYTARTKGGDCGSLLVAYTNDTSGFLCGIHIYAFEGREEGYSVIITRPDLEHLIGGTAQMDESRFHDFSVMVPSIHYDVGLDSRYDVLQTPRLNRKTKYVESPISIHIDTDKEPAILSCNDFRNKSGEDPLYHNVKKNARGGVYFSVRNSVKKEIVDAVSDYLEIRTPREYKRKILSNDEIVNGTESKGGALKRVNPHTSAGYPYCLYAGTGKSSVMHFDEEKQKWHFDDVVWNTVSDRERHALNCEMYPSFWTNCLKDELLPKRKIEAEIPKTRVFTYPPVDYTLTVRKYFGDFVDFILKKNIEIGFATAFNPESSDWHKIATKLLEKNEIAGELDYSEFDGSVPADFFYMFVDIVNKWYNDGPKRAVVRKILIQELVRTHMFVENTVVVKSQGNPSGSPLTTITNCFTSLFLLMLYYKHAVSRPDNDLNLFFKNVSFFVCGDDNIFTVDSTLFDEARYNVSINDVAKTYGFTVTDARKTTSQYFKNLSECTFLKRSFCKNLQGIYYPKIDEGSILGMLKYVRKSKHHSTHKALAMNIDTALRYYFFYGRERYDAERKRLTELYESSLGFDSEEEHLYLPTYDTFNEMYWSGTLYVYEYE